jgi:DNA-binding response OmpR family regulator
MKTILVVDDEFGIAEALDSTLTDEGYRVFTAANGKQGMVVLEEVKADLVIVDYMMPIWGGHLMVKAMRDSELWKLTPVIMMSAVAEQELRKISDGYSAYLRKPFDLDALLSAVRKLLGE